MSMFNDTERDELVTGGRFAMSKKAKHEHIATTSRDAEFAAVVGRGQYFVTKPSVLTEDGDLVSICRAYIRDRREVEPICGIQDDVRIGPVPNVVVTHTHADFTPLRYKFLVISRGQAQHVLQRLDMDDTDLDDVNRPNPDRHILSGRGRLLAEDSLCLQIPTNAPPPTSRSDMTHLSRVSLEPTRAQGDLVRSSEFSLVKAPPIRPGQRYIGMNHRMWNTVPACKQVDNSVLHISKIITNRLRHSHKLRVPDGAISWTFVDGEHSTTPQPDKTLGKF